MEVKGGVMEVKGGGGEFKKEWLWSYLGQKGRRTKGNFRVT